MRKRSFILVLIAFLVLAAGAYATRRHGGGMMTWLGALHGHGGGH